MLAHPWERDAVFVFREISKESHDLVLVGLAHGFRVLLPKEEDGGDGNDHASTSTQPMEISSNDDELDLSLHL